MLHCPAVGDLTHRPNLEAMLAARATDVASEGGIRQVRVMALLVAGYAASGSTAIPMHLDSIVYTRAQVQALATHGIPGYMGASAVLKSVSRDAHTKYLTCFSFCDFVSYLHLCSPFLLICATISATPRADLGGQLLPNMAAAAEHLLRLLFIRLRRARLRQQREQHDGRRRRPRVRR